MESRNAPHHFILLIIQDDLELQFPYLEVFKHRGTNIPAGHFMHAQVLTRCGFAICHDLCGVYQHQERDQCVGHSMPASTNLTPNKDSAMLLTELGYRRVYPHKGTGPTCIAFLARPNTSFIVSGGPAGFVKKTTLGPHATAQGINVRIGPVAIASLCVCMQAVTPRVQPMVFATSCDRL